MVVSGFYTRMHAAGKGDTLSTMLMLGGFGLVTMDDFSIELARTFQNLSGCSFYLFDHANQFTCVNAGRF